MMQKEMRLQLQSTLRISGRKSAAPILIPNTSALYGASDTAGKSAPEGDDGLAGQKIFEDPIHCYLRAHPDLP